VPGGRYVALEGLRGTRDHRPLHVRWSCRPVVGPARGWRFGAV